MTNGGDAAEQVVRLSLEGFEVAAKLSGAAAKNIAVLLVSVLKQEQKTKGKARLTNMIKSGKELKVFSIPNKDLKKFTEQAKRYGVLYCVLRDKNTKGDNVPIDIIARAEDASKIQRIPPEACSRASFAPKRAQRPPSAAGAVRANIAPAPHAAPLPSCAARLRHRPAPTRAPRAVRQGVPAPQYPRSFCLRPFFKRLHAQAAALIEQEAVTLLNRQLLLRVFQLIAEEAVLRRRPAEA